MIAGLSFKTVIANFYRPDETIEYEKFEDGILTFYCTYLSH